MKNHFTQGKASKLRILLILILLVSLSLLTLSACNKVDVASISIVEDTIPQNVRVSEFDITKVSILVTDTDGNQSYVAASASMLTTESRESLKTGGNDKNITLIYGKKTTTFTVTLFDDDADLVTVTFQDRNKNTIKEITTLKGGSVTPPAHPVIEGMVADGWVNAVNEQVSFSAIESSITVKANYSQDIPIYTVTFKDFNDVTVGTMQVEKGSRIPGGISYTAPEGIEDWQWMVGNNQLDFEKYIVNGNVIVTMKVFYVEHTVKFVFRDKNNNIVALNGAGEKVRHGGSAKGAAAASAQLAQHGYNFGGWKSSYTNVQMDLIIEADATIFSYNVVFKNDEGAIISQQTVNHGDNAAPPSSPIAKTGHEFTGEWLGGSLTNITSDMEFTAVFVPKSIAITFYDGATPEIITRNYNTVITAENLGELKQKSGNILLGIYTDAALQNIIALPYTVTTPTTFYSKWIDTKNGNSELVYSEIVNGTRTVIGYNANDPIVYIPDRFGGADVVGIGDRVFEDKPIEKIYFGANITSIGIAAFKKDIGAAGSEENSKLSGELQLPANLRTIGANAFEGCQIESIVIPASVTSIGSGAFYMNTSLSSVTFAENSSITAIGDNVFYGCVSLSSIVLPSSVTSIGNGAFAGAGLTSIDLGDKVAAIGENAFADCDKLTSITGTAELAAIAELAFARVALIEVSLPAIATIGERAFENNKNLTAVTLGAALSTLESQVFINCSSLTSVIFLTETEDDVTTGITQIKDTAFENCNNLLNIVLPETLTSITALAFDGALKLQAIEVDSANAAFVSVGGVLFSKDMTALIAYPAGKIAEEYAIAEDVVTIKASAFKDAIIANLTVASTVAELEDNALNSMLIAVIEFLGDVPAIATNPISATLWKLYVPTEYLELYTAVTEFSSAIVKPEEYDDESFYDAESGLTYTIYDGKATIVAADRQRTTITVPEKLGEYAVTKIEAYAFANCDILASLDIQAKLMFLGEYAFLGCSALESISFATIQRAEASNDKIGTEINLNAFYDTPWYINRNLIIISDTAFEYKDVLDEDGEVIEVTTLTIPEGVEVLDAELFNNSAAASLTSIILPSTLEIIRAGAFKNTNIKSIAIPVSVNTIGEGAFEGAALLKTVMLQSSAITAISDYTFKNCISLQEIILPAAVKTIGKEAFYGCIALTKATLSVSLTTIGASAFENCSALPVLELPARVGVGVAIGTAAIGNNAFAGCDSLVYLRVWNEEPATLGDNVFGSTVYIYVESSDGEIIENYKTIWSQYESQIKDQKDSPEISFIVNEDIDGQVIESMKNLKIDSRKTAVLYEDDISATFKDSFPGYVFVCWVYESEASVWTPVTYPFRSGESTTLRARWVRTEEGSLYDVSIDDMEYSSALGGYILKKYSGNETRLVIPAVYGGYPLVMIGDEAFEGNDNITEIRFVPDLNGRHYLKYIGKNAFAEMDRLTEIVLPYSVIDIDIGAFEDCSNLKYIFIPQAVRGIGANAFAGCALLDIEFEVGSQLRYAEINSFSDTDWYVKQKDSQQNFVVAGRLIVEYVKKENQNLVTLPTNAVAVRANLFANDTDLVTVEIHAAIEFIGDGAFYNCTSLINIEFANSAGNPSQIKEVGVDAFYGTAWLRQQDEFVLAGTVLLKYEGKKAPDQEKFIVDLPDFVTIIDKNAFKDSALEEIRIGADSKLVRIEDSAFEACYNLKEITIPRLVTYIGKRAFYENTSLQKVEFSGNAVREIGEKAFFGCVSLGTAMQQFALPSALTELGASAFEGCSALSSISLENTALTQIKAKTFYGANNLSNVILPESVVALGAESFKGCTVLESITAGGNSALKEVAADALTDTPWYNREAPEGEEFVLIYIGNVLLKYRQKISSQDKPNVVVPAQIKYIAPRAFENSNIASILLPEGLLEIGEYAFAGCEYPNIIVVPSSVTKIGVYAFSNCEGLETVELGADLSAIDASLFDGSRNLTKVTVARRSYEELSEEQDISVRVAIEEGTLAEWLSENPGVFVGTELINPNAFRGTSSYLRIYIENDNISIELYKYFWGESVSNRLFPAGELPTVSFDFSHVPGASSISPMNKEWLTEQDLYTVYKDHTLLGWTDNYDNDALITLPHKVVKDMELKPVWLSNKREVNDFIGMTYTPNSDNTGVVISSYLPTGGNIASDDPQKDEKERILRVIQEKGILIIGSSVTLANESVPIIGVNSGVFNENNTQSIKKVIFTAGGGFNITNNAFKDFSKLEEFVVLGQNSYLTAIDGVLYAANGSAVAAYPRARQADGKAVSTYIINENTKKILANAFYGTKLKELTIPHSVTEIYEGAFDNNVTVEPGGVFGGLSNIIFGTPNELNANEVSQLEYVAYGAFDNTAWFKNMTSEFKLAGSESYILSYNGFEDKVTIPSTVTVIGVKAFKNNDLDNIVQLTIPASVRRINEDAFESCSSITTIIFNTGSALMDIANEVFNDTSWIDAMNLETSEYIVAGNILVSYKGGSDYLTLPNDIKVIGYNAFNNAQFTGITLHNSLLRIDENAFYGCDNLATIDIPASVTSIGKSAFYGCLDLTAINFAEGSTLKVIGDSAFAHSSKLDTITIPNTVEQIGMGAFEQCSALKIATFSANSNLKNLGERAFKGAKSLETIFIPDGLKEIKTSTFEACQGLKTVTFSSNNRNLTTIGKDAFRGCAALGSVITNSLLTVKLPTNVTHILDGAFAECINMYGIQMQGQIKSIGANAFQGCAKLANVTISTAKPPTINANSFNYSVHQKLRIYVNNGISRVEIEPDGTRTEITVVEDYQTAWGGEKVAKSSNIYVRGEQSFPLVQFYSITRVGEEKHLTGYDIRAEFLTAAKLPSIQDDEGRGMSAGFFRNPNFDITSQFAAGGKIEVIQDEVPLKLYVKWET